MKVTVENAEENQELKFPCLMISKDSKVVLFHSFGMGTLLESKLSFKPYGFYSAHWDMGDFKPFHGKITLQND
jgi:hypothetical protein